MVVEPEPRTDRISLDEKAGWWLIGTVIAKGLLGNAAGLDADDLPQHDQRVWWRCLQRIDAAGGQIDCLTVSEALEADGVLEDMGGPGQAIYLADHSPDIAHIDAWIRSIRKSAARRRLESEVMAIRQQLVDPTVTNEEIAARLADASNILTVSQPVQFRTMTSAELDAADLSTVFLIENILVKGQPAVAAAIRKMLKTTICGIDMALSLGSGSKFLGHFYVPRAIRVGLMSGESGDATIRETARRICWSKPWKNLSDYENVVWSFDLPRLGVPQTKRELIQFIRDHGLEVLIIDPAYLCLDLGEGAGNIFSTGPKLRELTEIGQETGCTIVIIHHCRKNSVDPFAPPELESIAWAGFQEWARQWILIGRREAYDAAQIGSHKLWLSVGGSAGHAGLWGVDVEEGSLADQGGRRWDVSVDGASKVIAETINEKQSAKEQQAHAKAERQLEADAAKLLAEYLKRPNGDTEKYFRERAHLSGARAGAANEKLLADGKIVPCEVKKNGRTWDAFKASGLIGTDRDSIGTENPVPMGALSGTTTPIGGSPDPAHRDTENSLFVNHGDSNPDGMPEWESKA